VVAGIGMATKNSRRGVSYPDVGILVGEIVATKNSPTWNFTHENPDVGVGNPTSAIFLWGTAARGWLEMRTALWALRNGKLPVL
jgi:hypothetical protein